MRPSFRLGTVARDAEGGPPAPPRWPKHAASGETRLSPLLIGRILKSLAGHEIEMLPEQAAPWRYFTAPGLGLIWFRPAVWLTAEAGSASSPFRKSFNWMAQRSSFSTIGSAEPESGTGDAAVLATTQRLIIVRPPANAETNTSPAMLASLAACYGPASDAAWIAAETLQAGGARPVTPCLWPRCRRKTRRAQNATGRRPPAGLPPRESASGLELLLGCPLPGRLNYGARLRSTGIAALPETDRLIGLLAHDIMRRVFAEGVPSPPLPVVGPRSCLKGSCPNKRPLLQPGMEAVRERARIAWPSDEHPRAIHAGRPALGGRGRTGA